MHRGFADLCLTAWLRRRPEEHVWYAVAENSTGRTGGCQSWAEWSGPDPGREPAHGMERETGVEPATSTLARLHSTTELFPLTPGNTGRTEILPGDSVDCQGERGRRLSRPRRRRG